MGDLGQRSKTDPNPWRLHMEFGYNWPYGFSGEAFENVKDDEDNR